MCNKALHTTSNPFSTRFTKPGKIDFIFGNDMTPDQMCEDFEEAGLLGQIVGPHGSGKSTLIRMLARSLEKRGFQVQLTQLSSGSVATNSFPVEKRPIVQKIFRQPRSANFSSHGSRSELDEIDTSYEKLPHRPPPDVSLSSHRVVRIVDGFEQLNWYCRHHFIRRCQNLGHGLLISTHRQINIPLLYQTQSNWNLALHLANKLWPEIQDVISGKILRQLYKKHHPNMREFLFACYDLYEELPPRKELLP